MEFRFHGENQLNVLSVNFINQHWNPQALVKPSTKCICFSFPLSFFAAGKASNGNKTKHFFNDEPRFSVFLMKERFSAVLQNSVELELKYLQLNMRKKFLFYKQKSLPGKSLRLRVKFSFIWMPTKLLSLLLSSFFNDINSFFLIAGKIQT